VATRTRASMSLRALLSSSRHPQLPVCVPRAPAPRPVRAPHAWLERSVLRRVPPVRFCGPPEPAPLPQPAEARRSRSSPRGRGCAVARSAVLAAVPRNPRRVARAVARRRLRAWGTHPQQPRARAPRPDRARHAAGPGGRCGGRGTQGNLERALAFVLLLYLRSERARERSLRLPAPHAPPHVTCAPRLLQTVQGRAAESPSGVGGSGRFKRGGAAGHSARFVLERGARRWPGCRGPAAELVVGRWVLARVAHPEAPLGRHLVPLYLLLKRGARAVTAGQCATPARAGSGLPRRASAGPSAQREARCSGRSAGGAGARFFSA
jgi:hypothetical protein